MKVNIFHGVKMIYSTKHKSKNFYILVRKNIKI
jgi:hypothetical protein